MTEHLKKTAAALERYDAALATRSRLEDEFGRGLRAEADYISACAAVVRRRGEIADSLREDTGRAFHHAADEIGQNLRPWFAEHLKSHHVVDYRHFASQKTPGIHIVDAWCPNCGSGARDVVEVQQ